MVKFIKVILNELGLEVNERFKIKLNKYEDRVFWFDDDGFLNSVPHLAADEKLSILYHFIYNIKKDDVISITCKSFKPVEGEEYFYITTLFDVVRDTWYDDAIDKNRYYTGLLFVTEGEAHNYHEFLKQLYEHCRFFDPEKPNYGYQYDNESDQLTIVRHFSEVSGTYYFDNEEINAFDEKVTDDEIKKYLFYRRGK